MLFTQKLSNLSGLEKKIRSNQFKQAKNKFYSKIKSNSYGFINDLYEKKIEYVYSFSDKLKNNENIIFLGTGGSSLGGKTLVSIKTNFFLNKKKPQIFFLENVDQVSISGLLDQLNMEKTSVVVISKSGETIETLAQFFFIKKIISKTHNYKKRIYVITENKQSTLKKIQEEEDYLFIEHNKNIGGRYSVFSVVGLLPAAVSSFNIKKFVEGGKKFLKFIENENNFDSFFFSSLAMILLQKKGVNISVIMPYVDNLNNLSFWYKQLWAESIGKKRMGTTPVNSLGTVDQHSQLQLFLDGPRDKFYTIIGRKKTNKQTMLDCSFGDKNKIEVLHKKSLEILLRAEMDATIQTLQNKKLPVRFFELESINEESVGSLMMYFFVETIFSCYLVNVNPFDQPAVEEGKILTKKKLKVNEY